MSKDEVRAEIGDKYACPLCGTKPVGPGSASCSACGSALPGARVHLAALAAGGATEAACFAAGAARLREMRAALADLDAARDRMAEALVTTAGELRSLAPADTPPELVRALKIAAEIRCEPADDETETTVEACKGCGNDLPGWMVGSDTGFCPSCIADKQADPLTMHDGDNVTVDNGMKNITVELVKCPRCGCMLADPGAPYCDGCAEGV